MPIDIVDIFAGPGGLGEGFSAVRNDSSERVFRIIASIEEKRAECKTLRMRSFYRKLSDLGHFNDYEKYLMNPTAGELESLINRFPSEWEEANKEIIEKRINQSTQVDIVKCVASRRDAHNPLILIGGPPCQAYSLAGRSRNAQRIKDDDENWQKDKRRTLYKRYLYFINKLEPDAFVMENVKGILSATLKDEIVFSRVRKDLQSLGYTLYSLASGKPPKELSANDFIIRSEDYGIPQKRHRVIILGVSNSIKKRPATLAFKAEQLSVEDCIGDLPRIRSMFSEREKVYNDDTDTWRKFVTSSLKNFRNDDDDFRAEPPTDEGGEWVSSKTSLSALSDWYRPFEMTGVPNHHSKAHISTDISRYIFCATKADRDGISPKINEFPIGLLPEHKNVAFLRNPSNSKHYEIAFADRFRVQLRDEPATTITSHISKDGHYYIHYDPTQARSLTVREAARLQTFPDDYRFEGNRTEQYHQVGNAVPPFLAYQIAKIVAKLII